MFEMISCYVSGDRIEVNGQGFLLGELTTDLLGVRPNEFQEMYSITQQMEKWLGAPEPKEHLVALRTEMGVLCRMLRRYKLFQVISQVEATEGFDLDMDLFDGDDVQDQLRALLAKAEEASILAFARRYCEIVRDIYSFNQTIFHFIDRHIMHLEKLNPGNYAAALYSFFTNPRARKVIVNPIENNGFLFSTMDWMQVQFVPREVPGKRDEYAICEYYHMDSLQSFLKVDFYRALMAGHVIRRCKNCKLFFLLTKGHHTEYCDRPLPDRPHRSCRNQASKDMAKEKAKNNPVLHSYERACQRVRKDCDRSRITEAEKEQACRKLRDLRDEAISGMFRDTEVDARMQSNALYAALGIVRQGGR